MICRVAVGLLVALAAVRDTFIQLGLARQQQPMEAIMADAKQQTSSTPSHQERNGKHLTRYLNDHLAGSTAIINLLQHLERTRRGKDMHWFLVTLRGDVVADRVSLEGVMERAQVKKHRRRTATAWLIEKLSRMKLRSDDNGDGALKFLEGLELVEVGIEGKRELWRALAATSGQMPMIKGIDFGQLIQRAEQQHERVEALRIETAKVALVYDRDHSDLTAGAPVSRGVRASPLSD
jgi:HAMP domain-containing protein